MPRRYTVRVANERNLAELMRIVGHEFADAELLAQALVHRSYANEQGVKTPDNERLEFVGDAVVGLVVADVLFSAMPDQREGVLSSTRAAIVSERGLSAAAERVGLGDWLATQRKPVGPFNQVHSASLQHARHQRRPWCD